MSKKLVIPLVLLTLLPALALGWLGWRLAAEEQARLQRGVQGLLQKQLADEGERISSWLRAFGQALAEDLQDFAKDPTRHRPGAGIGFLLGTDGALLRPHSAAAAGTREADFLSRTQRIWEDRTLLHQQIPIEGDGRPLAPEAPQGSGWYAWHWANGLNLLFWKRLEDGRIAGVEVDRFGLLARLIGALPSHHDRLPHARIRLLDARGRVLYQWGRYEPADEIRPLARLALDPPLESWHLEYLADPSALGLSRRAGGRMQILSGVLAVVVVLLLGGVLLYRELTRAMREASQRVNFVNQVSHELKTPLTNIRLYAELLRSELDEHGSEARRLDVIVNETQRLSRLIANVLSLARGQRGALRLHPQSGDFDACVSAVLAQFEPALETKGIRIERALSAGGETRFDPDALAQIVGNLLGNVEKYLPAGGSVRVASARGTDRLELRVQDDGPGIPKAHRSRIFRPFYRIRSDLTEGVSGAGIGLAIARDLARLHGGDLELEPSDQGASFCLWLPQ